MSGFANGIHIEDMDTAKAKVRQVTDLCQDAAKAVKDFTDSIKELDGLIGNNLSEVVGHFEVIAQDLHTLTSDSGSVYAVNEIFTELCRQVDDTQSEQVRL